MFTNGIGNAFVYFMSISILDIRVQPFPSENVHAAMGLPDFRWTSNRDVRSADALRVFVAPPPKPPEVLPPEPVEVPPAVSVNDPKYAEYIASPVYKKYQTYVESVKKYKAYEDSPEVKKYKAYLASPAYAAYVEAEAEAARIKAVQQCRAMLFIRDDAFFQNLVDRGFLKKFPVRTKMPASH